MYYLGRKISELTKEELIDALIATYKDSEMWRDRYFGAEKSKIEYMGLLIKK